MKRSLSFLSTALILQSTLFSYSASALNIVLTNDDSWSTNNIKEMKQTLEDNGHDVIMAAPCLGQSGKGGAFNSYVPVHVDDTKAGENEYCVGDIDKNKAFKDFTEGTPIMAVLYGIDIAAQKKWGQSPDLVVSGANEGNNLGYLNNNSGTLGATMIALSRGIPAIAVSASLNSAVLPDEGSKVASIVADIISNLEANRPEGEPLLPPYMGLNVNTPTDLDNNLGYKFTDVGWNGGGGELRFIEDLSSEKSAIKDKSAALVKKGMSEDEAKLAAQDQLNEKGGVVFIEGDAGDSDPQSEGVAVMEGYITISTIDGNIQAARAKVELTEQRLRGLGQ